MPSAGQRPDGRLHGIGRRRSSCPAPCVSLLAMHVHVQPFLLDVDAATGSRSCGGLGSKTTRRTRVGWIAFEAFSRRVPHARDQERCADMRSTAGGHHGRTWPAMEVSFWQPKNGRYLTSLNVSHCVACKIWRRHGVSLLRGRAHRLHRREPFRGLLRPMDIFLDLLQTAIN
jgi:hypothetical protein